MRKDFKIMIFDTNTDNLEKLYTLYPDYTLNDYNILLDTQNTPVNYYDTNCYDISNVVTTLRDNNISIDQAILCPDCNTWTNEFYTINSKNGNFFVCSDCSSDYTHCDHCGDYFDDTYNTFDAYDRYGNEITICEDCRWNNFTECADCGDIYPSDSEYIHYCDDCDDYYCDNCWDDHYHEENLLYDYHSFRDWQPHNLPEEDTPEFYIGHELEIDDGSDMRQAVKDISTLCNGICMHDGSLSDQGIEFISHPLSYKYMLSLEENYRKLFDNLINLGYKSHNTDTCGLHFHVTKPENSKIIDRIILFMETYKEEIFTLSRRKTEELNRWARFLSDKRTGTNPKVIKSLDYIVNNKDYSDRYQALNLTNSRTIEFRFFKGTLKYETFMADLEFVNNLVHFASDLTIPVEELTWTKITSVGHYLPQYIEEHNLQSTKPIIDYSKELLVTFNEDKSQLRIEVDNLIAELLKNITNRARTKNNTSQKLRATINTIYNWNENLSSLQYELYEIENLSPLNYNGLESIKRDLQSIKNRIGGNR